MDLQLPAQLVSVNTEAVSSNPAHHEVLSIQHYVVKFVSDLRWVLRFPPPIELTATMYLKYC